MKAETINIISNLNTINIVELKKKYPLSYAFLSLGRVLFRHGYGLEFVNQDNNRVYFRTINKENGKKSYIMDLSHTELLSIDMYILQDIIEECV